MGPLLRLERKSRAIAHNSYCKHRDVCSCWHRVENTWSSGAGHCFTLDGAYVLLVNHDLGIGLLVVVGGLIVHLHGIVSAGLHIVFLQLVFALVLEVDTAIVGDVLLFSRLGSLDSSHLGIATRSGGDSLAVLIGSVHQLLLLSLFGELIGAIFVLIRLRIGFGLLRGEFGWGRGFRVPGSS